MSHKSILVTGAGGFIGSNLVLELNRRFPFHKILVIDKRNYAYNSKNLQKAKIEVEINCDIGEPEKYTYLFVDYDVEYVFHLAAESHVDKSISDPALFFESNVIGTQKFFQAIQRCKEMGELDNLKKIVNVSTDEVMGHIQFGSHVSFTEDWQLNPTSPYAASKAGQEMVGNSYFKTFGLPIVTTRCSNNYGPRQDKTKLIPKTIKCIDKLEDLTLYNKGQNERDWLWVMDHVDGLIKSAQKGKPGEVYLFGTNISTKNIDVINMIQRDTFFSVGFDHAEDRKAHDEVYRCDYTKAERELGWRPTIDLETGLTKTAYWYENNKWALQ